MKNFGFTAYDRVAFLGTNGKMNEFSAAVGLTNLESLDEFVSLNRRNHKQYADELAELKGLSLLAYDEAERCNYQYVVLEIDESKTLIGRDQLMEILHQENVLARRYFYPGCHRMEPYNSLYPDAYLSLPETERLAERVLTLPTGQQINSQVIRSVCNIIRTVLANADEVCKLIEEKSAA